jgi:maleate cis-trans isomerase
MYGWRARIAHIYPAVVAETIFNDFFSMVPDGVTLLITNLTIRALKKEDLEDALEGIDHAAMLLAERNPDIIIIGGAPMIRLKGLGSDKELIDRIHRKTGILTSTSQTSAIEAFQALGAKKLVVASPYHDDQNEQVKNFLQNSGFDVLNIVGLRKNVVEIHETPLAEAYRHAKNVFLQAPDADAVYVPCAHFSVPHIAQLEREIGRPVVTSTMAMVWNAFQKLSIKPGIQGKGQLLEGLG